MYSEEYAEKRRRDDDYWMREETLRSIQKDVAQYVEVEHEDS